MEFDGESWYARSARRFRATVWRRSFVHRRTVCLRELPEAPMPQNRHFMTTEYSRGISSIGPHERDGRSHSCDDNTDYASNNLELRVTFSLFTWLPFWDIRLGGRRHSLCSRLISSDPARWEKATTNARLFSPLQLQRER